jgi:hypothetical protein
MSWTHPKKLTFGVAPLMVPADMNPKSLRKRKSVLSRISAMQKKNIVSPDKEAIYDIYDEYIDSAPFTEEEFIDFYQTMDAILIANVRDYLEPRIIANTITNTEAGHVVFAQPFEDVRDRLWSMLDTWILQYRGPVVALADIVADSQNVHIPSILKKTTDSVLLLSNVPIPDGQKTLHEIRAEFLRVLMPAPLITTSAILTYYATHLDEYEKCPRLKELLSQEYERILREPITGKSVMVVKRPKCAFKYMYVFNAINAMTTITVGMTKGDAAEAEAEVEAEPEAEAEVEPEAEAAEAEVEVEAEAEAEAEVEVEAAEAAEAQVEAAEAVVEAQVEADAASMLDYLSNYFYRLREDTINKIWNHYLDKELDIEEKIKKEIDDVIADMRDWGNRKTVIKPGENIYKSTLRGLWAKIKESPSRTELVKRLFEETSEAVGLCADGHVGRLCNVLVGFDPEFTCSLSPKEYFQNNIALISENIHASLEAKIQQAKALMDEIGMPEEERQAWLDAF